MTERGSALLDDQRCDDPSLLAVLIVMHLDDGALRSVREEHRIALGEIIPIEVGDPDHATGGVDQAI
jgi:hypothetical protein